MNKKKIIAVMLLGATLMTTGCKDKCETSTEPQDIQVLAEDIKNSEESVDLSASEVHFFTDYFNDDKHNGFVRTQYDCPENIKWDDVLYNGEIGHLVDEDSEEGKLASERFGVDFVYLDAFAIKKPDLEKFVEEYTGTKYEDANYPLSDAKYMKEYDSLYYAHGDSFRKQVTCIEGRKLGDNYVITLEPVRDADSCVYYEPKRELTFVKKDDKYQMKSCKFLWEDGCDKSQTFDAEFNQFDGKCRFVTFPYCGSYGCKMLITVDGNMQAWLNTDIYCSDGEYHPWDSIDAVGFFDYNGDALTDIAVIGEVVGGQHIMLYSGRTDGEFDLEQGLSCMAEPMLDAITIPDMKKFLLGDNKDGKFGTYQEAYGHIVKLNSIEMPDGCLFDLIYYDEDDVPELVCNLNNERIDVYTYEDGHVTKFMDDYYYFDSDNPSYKYAEKKGVVAKIDILDEGLTTSAMYYVVKKGHLRWCCDGYEFHWKDTNKDGFVDSDEDDTYIEEPYYINISGISDDEDENKKNYELFSKYEYKALEGKMNADQLLKELGN